MSENIQPTRQNKPCDTGSKNYDDLGPYEGLLSNQRSLNLLIHILKAYFPIENEPTEKSTLSLKP